MFGKPRGAAVLLAALCALAGIVVAPAAGRADPVPPPPDRGFIVRMAAGHPRDAIALVFPRGAVFSIAVKENPSTGYTWLRRPPTGPAATFLDTDLILDPSAPGQVGAGGTRYFRYWAAHPGAATIRLRYQRPWERAPVAWVVVRIRVVQFPPTSPPLPAIRRPLPR